MQVAYVGGPYRDSRGDYYVTQNIERAKYVSVELWRKGYAVICPHCNTAYFSGALSDEADFLDGGLELLSRCDLLVVIDGWQKSQGTKAEIQMAHQKGIPVYYWPNLSTPYPSIDVG